MFQAMLTTFQEVDMSGLIKMRKERFPSAGVELELIHVDNHVPGTFKGYTPE